MTPNVRPLSQSQKQSRRFSKIARFVASQSLAPSAGVGSGKPRRCPARLHACHQMLIFLLFLVRTVFKNTRKEKKNKLTNHVSHENDAINEN
jgi:hypothetical protein